MKRKDKNTAIKERMKLVEKEQLINISIKIGIIIDLKHLPKEYSQVLVVLLREKARK